MGKEIFQEVYPFTTEVISGYFNELDFKDKSVMTLGSSSDQAFNALLLGAKKITVYDINENTAKTRLARGRNLLKIELGRNELYEENI